MKRTWPIIGVADVQASSKWYRTLLNAGGNHPGDSTFAQVLDEDGTVLLCLHHWGDHGHPSLMSPDNGTPGNGLLLFFCVSDFDSALRNARTLTARLPEEPRVNPNTRALEFALLDPDGYYVMVSAFQPA
jgi:catechol 2,3-dioxygenase-like lactoylglutathione lyase family enzyme